MENPPSSALSAQPSPAPVDRLDASAPRFPPIALHELSSNNRGLLAGATLCGCFHCLRVFTSASITAWCDLLDSSRQTALCPRCGIDAVIPCTGSLAETARLLAGMKRWWFGPSVSFWRDVESVAAGAREIPRLLRFASENDRSPWQQLHRLLGGGRTVNPASVVAVPFLADIATARANEPSCVTPLVVIAEIERLREQQGGWFGMTEMQMADYRDALRECAAVASTALAAGWASGDEPLLQLLVALRRRSRGARNVRWPTR